ncbi:MAG: C1 family peptidase [Bacteroidota bacterium]|jgi:bleomycin hydrolase
MMYKIYILLKKQNNLRQIAFVYILLNFCFNNFLLSQTGPASDLNGFTPITNNKTVSNKKGSQYKLTILKSIESTPVKNQGMTGTCWSFSSISFFESELNRIGKGKDYNLSEMFVARMAYPLKAENYIRMHGKAQFGEGGEFHDVVHVMRKYGMVPQEVYNGNLKPGEDYDHHKMDSALLALVKSIASNDQKIDLSWRNKLNEILDKHLGKIPSTFEYKGKQYTPESYAKELGVSPDDYLYLSSFTHQPFYKEFTIEIPDNWMWERAHNLPLDEMIACIDNALNNGYGVAWAADVSEPTFRFKDGLAILPEKKFESLSFEEKNKLFSNPCPQKNVTQEERQVAFDNYETQDDHGMHMVGIAKDQNNTKYYIIKNSWGNSNDCEGYFFASEAYVRMKTVSIMIHKNALPSSIKNKLSLR